MYIIEVVNLEKGACKSEEAKDLQSCMDLTLPTPLKTRLQKR